MHPSPDPRDPPAVPQFSSDDHIGIMVMWSDGSLSCGRDATDLLRSDFAGWNPKSLTRVRRILAQRSGIAPPRQGESNRRFLDRLAAAGSIVIFDVDRHFPELTDPPFDDAA